MRKKNEDVIAQLGEPLPLPYKVNESSRINPDYTQHHTTIESLYKRHDMEKLRSLEAEIEEEEDVTPIVNKPIQLIRQRPNPIRREFIGRLKDIELINSLETDLEYIKELIVNNRLTAKEVQFLQDMKLQLNSQLLNPQEIVYDETKDDDQISPVMAELERLQNRINPDVTSMVPQKTITTEPGLIGQLPIKKILLILLCTIIFLSIPYVFRLSSYDYCYYFC